MNTVKQELYDLCCRYVDQRIGTAEEAIQEATNASRDDTKSSAGDKYETGREMMQQEIDRNQKQLAEARKLRVILNHINPQSESNIAGNGSLVYTNYGNFYISVSAGQLTVKESNYFAIAAASPIGLSLMGKKAGASFDFNGKAFEIIKIE